MKKDKKEQAKELFCRGHTVEEIANIVNTPESTIYRWKNNEDWDKAKRLYNLSLDEIQNILSGAIRESILDIEKNPLKLQDSKIADSLVKVLSTIKKFDKDVDYLGAITDVMSEATETIKTKFPSFLQNWQEVVPVIFSELEKKHRG